MKMKKKLTILVLAVLVLTSLFGCGKSGLTLSALEKKGELTIATSPDFPPFESLADGGSDIVGIEVDIMNLICEELGVEPVYEQMDFDSVLPGVQAGKYDVGMSGITVTPAREKNALFTDPYCLAAQAIVVMEGSEITCKADLEGKTVSVQTGTTAESFCTEAGYAVNAYAANNDAESALVSGKVDAWVIDDLTAADMVAAKNAEGGEQLVILDEAMTTEPYAFGFPLGSEEVVDKINGILQGLVEDGTVAAIFEQYGAPYTAPDAE